MNLFRRCALSNFYVIIRKGLEFCFEASEKYSAPGAPDVTVTNWHL
jgi:hypothetical protein